MALRYVRGFASSVNSFRTSWLSNEAKSAITQAQQEFTSRLAQNVRSPLSIMPEDNAMNTIKLAIAPVAAARAATTPFAAQAQKDMHTRHSIFYQTCTSGPCPT